MSTPWRSLVVVVLAFTATLPSDALAAKSVLLGVAEQSVAVSQLQTGSATAFAYGPEGGVVTTGSNGSIHMITSTGATFSGEVSTSRDGLGVAHVAALPLRPLIATSAASVGHRTPKYILGPPLGYEGGRIRSVRMPTVRLTGTQLQRIIGALPVKFLGAPVVTTHGRLIGSVANVGAKSWQFAPLGLLKKLAVAHQGTTAPIVPIVVGGLVVFLAGMVFGILRVKRRRDREIDLSLRQSRARGAAERRAEGPLVRSRAPSAEQEPIVDGDEDFEVIVKPRRDET